jgi:acyl dehydratase
VIGPTLYFEDLGIGDTMETPAQTVTETDVVRYASLTGNWEAHATDAAAARSSEDGERVIPNILALCISSGLGWRGSKPPTAILAFMGLEWQFLRAIRIGDTIRTRSRMAAKRSLKESGVVVEEREIVNQRGEVVQSGKITLLVAKRPCP